MTSIRIYADFQNADERGRLRLNCVGTARDLARSGVQLRDGLAVTVYSDDAGTDNASLQIEAGGIVRYSDEEQCWVAEIDWEGLRRKHTTTKAAADGAAKPSNQVNGVKVRKGARNARVAIDRKVLRSAKK